MGKKAKKQSFNQVPKEEFKVINTELPELGKKDIKKFRLQFVFTIALVLLGAFIYFKYRTYIGYYLGGIAIPYGVYGLFRPYKSAVEYAKDGYQMTYSRQFGVLMISLGVLGIVFSIIYPTLAQNKWFLIVMLVYLAIFFFAMSTLQKRYMKQPVLESQIKK